ncbi:MAG: hypothetical protein QXQ19_00440 [Candidatus Aenigmatarchaeota archaeon]
MVEILYQITDNKKKYILFSSKLFDKDVIGLAITDIDKDIDINVAFTGEKKGYLAAVLFYLGDFVTNLRKNLRKGVWEFLIDSEPNEEIRIKLEILRDIVAIYKTLAKMHYVANKRYFLYEIPSLEKSRTDFILLGFIAINCLYLQVEKEIEQFMDYSLADLLKAIKRRLPKITDIGTLNKIAGICEKLLILNNKNLKQEFITKLATVYLKVSHKNIYVAKQDLLNNLEEILEFDKKFINIKEK